MRELALSDFSNAVGTSFAVDAGDAQVTLTLAEAAELTPSVRAGGSFRLEFRGPREPLLEQATYRFAGQDGECEIFIVPIAQDQSGMTYEAIFY